MARSIKLEVQFGESKSEHEFGDQPDVITIGAGGTIDVPEAPENLCSIVWVDGIAYLQPQSVPVHRTIDGRQVGRLQVVAGDAFRSADVRISVISVQRDEAAIEADQVRRQALIAEAAASEQVSVPAPSRPLLPHETAHAQNLQAQPAVLPILPKAPENVCLARSLPRMIRHSTRVERLPHQIDLEATDKLRGGSSDLLIAVCKHCRGAFFNG